MLYEVITVTQQGFDLVAQVKMIDDHFCYPGPGEPGSGANDVPPTGAGWQRPIAWEEGTGMIRMDMESAEQLLKVSRLGPKARNNFV